MNKQTKSLIVLIIILLLANVGLMIGKRTTRSMAYDEKAFAIQDTSSVKTINIGEIELQKNNGWFVNNEPADPAFIDHLLNVMLRVRIKKPVGNAQDGLPISINGEESFIFSANATKTKTFFSNEDGAFEVEIPGFTDYLGGIFELNSDQWKDRLILNGSWRTIQKLSLDYVDSNADDFTIQFQKNFFIVLGLDAIDTTFLVNYLNQYQYFQANERISEGRIAGMDSLRRTKPLAILTIEDINYPEPIELEVYPRRKEDGFHLFLDANKEMVAVDASRSGQVLRRKSDFQFKR